MKTLQIKKWVMTKKGNQFEVLLPAKRVVCPECEGSGKVLCDGLRGVAIDPEHMEDPDFEENYFGGNYDVRCDICDGQNVIIEVDYQSISVKMQDRLSRQAREDYASAQEHKAELKWGY